MRHKLLARFFLATIAIAMVFAFQSQAEETKTVKIKTNGHGQHCKTIIEDGLKTVDGVVSSDFNISDKIVTVKYNSQQTNERSIVNKLASLGYDTSQVEDKDCDKTKKKGCCSKKKEECKEHNK